MRESEAVFNLAWIQTFNLNMYYNRLERLIAGHCFQGKTMGLLLSRSHLHGENNGLQQSTFCSDRFNTCTCSHKCRLARELPYGHVSGMDTLIIRRVIIPCKSELQTRLNRCNNSQHCRPNNVESSCIRLRAAKSLTCFKILRNN